MKKPESHYQSDFQAIDNNYFNVYLQSILWKYIIPEDTESTKIEEFGKIGVLAVDLGMCDIMHSAATFIENSKISKPITILKAVSIRRIL